MPLIGHVEVVMIRASEEAMGRLGIINRKV